MKFMVVTLIVVVGIVPNAAGAKEAVVGGKTYQLEEVFYDDFKGDLSNWRIEGDALLRLYGGFMEVNAIEDVTSTEVGASTIWCVKEFEGSQIVEYDVRLMGDTVFTNVNMFLLASMASGKAILETSSERNGKYSQYHTFPNYLVTVINQNSPAEQRQMLRIRMRSNPGFELENECWQEPLIIGKIHHIVYVIDPPDVSVIIDDRQVCRNVYATTLTKGLHGLRVYHTHSLYGNFKVSRILK